MVMVTVSVRIMVRFRVSSMSLGGDHNLRVSGRCPHGPAFHGPRQREAGLLWAKHNHTVLSVTIG